MNEIMVDTDVLIDLSRHVPECMDFFDGLSEEATICISVISEMEILAGCRNKSEQETARTFMEDFAVILIEGDDLMKASNPTTTFY